MLGAIRSGASTVLRARVRVGGVTKTLIASAAASMQLREWYHAALTYNGSSLKLFLDGQEVASTTLSGAVDQDSGIPVAIGSQPGGGKHFDGNIDDVRILQRALSLAEIQSISGSQTNPSNPTATTTTESFVGLAWLPVADAVEYRVFRNGVLLATVDLPEYGDFTARSGVDYRYEIIAVNASGGASPIDEVNAFNRSSATGNWWGGAWNFRTRVSIASGSARRENSIAVIPLDLDALLLEAGGAGSHNESRVRCVEINSGGDVVDEDIRCQSGDGELVVQMDGVTPVATTRYFHVYFDNSAGGEDDPRAPQVTLSQNRVDEGFASYLIENDTGAIFYHTAGGGISSMVDVDGIDWINHSAQSGSFGEFRGIPNMVPPAAGGYFHPGFTTATTTLVDRGPLRVRFEARSDNREWRAQWDVFPDHIRIEVLDKPSDNYWFLYEGTPGGVLDSGDSTVRSTGSASEVSGLDSWNADIAGEEWVMVNASEVQRSLYIAKQRDDQARDSYRPATGQGIMTVLGLGRGGSAAELTDTGEVFYVGFLETQNFVTARSTIRSIIRPINTGYSGPAIRP